MTTPRSTPARRRALRRRWLRAPRRRRAARLPGRRARSSTAWRCRSTPDVLVPRPDTETLVDWALECLRRLRAAARRACSTWAPAAARSRWRCKHAPAATQMSRGRRQRTRRWRWRAATRERLGLDVELRRGRLVAAAGAAGASTWCCATRPTSPTATRIWRRCATSRRWRWLRRRTGLDGVARDRRRAPGAPGARRLAAARARLRPGRRGARGCCAAPASAQSRTRRDLAGQPRCTGGALSSRRLSAAAVALGATHRRAKVRHGTGDRGVADEYHTDVRSAGVA